MRSEREVERWQTVIMAAVPEATDQADRRLAGFHRHDLVLPVYRDIVIVVVFPQVAFERRAHTGIIVNC